jgi:HEAT repeat protein
MRYLKTFFLLTLIAVLCIPALAADKAAKANTRAEQRKLIELLQGNAAPADKALACKRLALIGDGDAVPALAALLPQAELSGWARIALEVIPDISADDALRTACGQLQGRLRVGVINSLAVRHDTKAVDRLIGLLEDSDHEVAAAAAVALGRIGTDAAVATLRSSLAIEPMAVRSAVAEGCILCAERNRAHGESAEAVKLYDAVRAADLPQTRILEATRGAILARGAEGVPLLVKELQSADKQHFALGLFVARELPGPEATEAVAAELARAVPQRQSLLILALADRGESSVVPQIVKAAKGSSPQVRVYALRALKRVDEAVSAPILLDAAAEDDATIAQAALGVIDALQGPAIDNLIAQRLPAASGGAGKILVELAGRRHVAAATPILWKAADDADAKVRAAALTALGGTIQFAELPQLIARLRAAQNDEEAAAIAKALQDASQRMPDPEACGERLAAALAGAPVALKCKLLEVLGALGGQRALAAMGDAARQSDEVLRDTAFRLLGQWKSVDAAPLLTDLAKNTKDEKCQVRAVRGYIRLARQFVIPQADRAAMCRTALEIARRPDDKRLVLEILLRYPSPEMLDLALEAAKAPDLKEEAAIVAMGIERASGGNSIELRKALAQAGHKTVKLEILKAEYGEGGQVKDVTAILRRYARNFRVIFLPSSSYNESFGGDPASGVVKHLRIRYRIDGKEGEATLNEDATVVLPIPR